MYFPYFRGRQYELIALRELVEMGLIGNKVLPVVEPIDISSTFVKTLKAFTDKGHDLLIVYNPKVGSCSEKHFFGSPESKYEKEFQDYLTKDNIKAAHILNPDSEGELSVLSDKGKKVFAFINVEQESFDRYKNLFKENSPEYFLAQPMMLIDMDDSFESKKVLFEDRFKKCRRNSDYANEVDSFFSADHLKYTKFGFDAFGDYSVIGSEYLDGGFAPYAVAIHMVYFDEKKQLRIRHYVSDSNEDITDPAGKFYEAVTKLCEDQKNIVCDYNIKTHGLKQFIDLQREQKYPGLGCVKKFSVMHHLELMNNFLESQK